MPVIKTFISHTGSDLDRIRPLLRKVAPLGVRPWIDKEDLAAAAGRSLTEQLEEAIFVACSALSFFISESSVERRWVKQEVQWARDGRPVIPIALDGIKESAEALPDSIKAALGVHGKPGALSVDKIWLDSKDKAFAEKYAGAVFNAAGIKNADDLVLHLGHRSDAEASIYEPWQAWPALDLRMDMVGDKDFSPTPEQWAELDAAMKLLRQLLAGVKRVHVCGLAPLGIGGLVGKHWDRRSGVELIEAHNHYQGNHQVWRTLAPEDEDRAMAFQPQAARMVKMSPPALAEDHGGLLVAFAPAEMQHYHHKIESFQQQLGAPPLCLIKVPRHIGSPDEARTVLTECLGALYCIRRSYNGPIDLVTTLPLALQPLFFHYHRQVFAPMRVHDQVLPERDYRLAFSL